MTGGVLFRTLPVLVNVRGRGTGARSGGERGEGCQCWIFLVLAGCRSAQFDTIYKC